MSHAPDTFDALKRLLRIKRHEPPPPRYFKDFSGQVLARIERGEARLSWWERFGFDLRPALAAGAGLAACGLIVYGVATTDGDAGQAGVPVIAGLAAGGSPTPSLFADPEKVAQANSTNPVPSLGTPVDPKFRRSMDAVVPVSFQRP